MVPAGQAPISATSLSSWSARFEDDAGTALAFLRGSRSQSEVARRAGVSRSSLSLYERGTRRPRERNLAKLLEVVGATREELAAMVWKIHRGRVLAASPEIKWPPPASPPAGSAGIAQGGPAARGGLAPPSQLPELRARLRTLLSSLADPLADVLVLAVRTALSKRPGLPPGR